LQQKENLFLTDFIQLQKLKTIQRLKENQMEFIENSIKRPHANSVSFNYNSQMSPLIKFKSSVFQNVANFSNVDKDQQEVYGCQGNKMAFNEDVYVSCNKNN
jgi:hypothetical protein